MWYGDKVCNVVDNILWVMWMSELGSADFKLILKIKGLSSLLEWVSKTCGEVAEKILGYRTWLFFFQDYHEQGKPDCGIVNGERYPWLIWWFN